MSLNKAYASYLSKKIKHILLRGDENPFRSKQFLIVESQTLDNEVPAVILAPPSMLTSGPSVDYLEQICGDPKIKLILSSFQAQGTPGRLIQDGSRQVIINGENIRLDCQVERIEGFNTHSDYNQSIAYITRLQSKLRRVLVNHGERGKVQNLATSI